MTILRDDDRAVLAVLESLALEAGRRIMAIRAHGFAAETKPDCSPVTQADREAEAIILTGLRAHFPGVAVVAEEEAAAGAAPQVTGKTFFLVDPLDGTREFVRGGADFTVNIALVRDGAPLLGVVYAPALATLYAGRPGMAEAVDADGRHQPGARRAITARQAGAPLKILASRSHRTAQTDAFIARLQPAELVAVGSSLKFCLLAAGEADLYPRLGRTMQWDTAAGDAVLRAAGGVTVTLEGAPLRYGGDVMAGDAPFVNPHFIAAGRLPPDALPAFA